MLFVRGWVPAGPDNAIRPVHGYPDRRRAGLIQGGLSRYLYSPADGQDAPDHPDSLVGVLGIA